MYFGAPKTIDFLFVAMFGTLKTINFSFDPNRILMVFTCTNTSVISHAVVIYKQSMVEVSCLKVVYL